MNSSSLEKSVCHHPGWHVNRTELFVDPKRVDRSLPTWRGLTYLPDLPPTSHLLHTSTSNSICATHISQFEQSRFLQQWPTHIHCIPWVKHAALGVQFKHARYNQSGILYAHVWLHLVIGYPVLNGLYTKLACNWMLFHALLANYWH